MDQRNHACLGSIQSGKPCKGCMRGLPKTSSAMSYQLDAPRPPAVARTCCTDSGYPLVVMVQPTHYRNSDHLVPCMMRGKSRSARFRNLLLDALMRSCLVEVRHIRIEHALELLLVEDQQVVKAFLSDTPQEAFADRIGSWCMIGRFENLNAHSLSPHEQNRTQICYRYHESDTSVLAHTGSLLGVVAPPRDRSEIVSRLRGSPSVT